MSDFTVPLADGAVAYVDMKPNQRARRYILRFDDRRGIFRLTVPGRGSHAQAKRFALSKAEWMQSCLAGRSADRLVDGAVISFLGHPHRLVFSGEKTRSIIRSDGVLKIGGPSDLAPSRLKRFLIAEAKARLTPLVHTHAKTLGATAAKVRYGDMRSRWGSCSSARTVKLNWRLVMAPQDVQNYVVAHEVAHLLEMNHSDRFWAHVEGLVPDWRLKRQWLRHEGARLMAYDFEGQPTGNPVGGAQS